MSAAELPQHAGRGSGGSVQPPEPVAVTEPTLKRSKLASVVSGSMSGALVSACVQPLDVLRTRIQADAAHGTQMSTAQTLRAVIKQGGVRALWQGTQPTVVRLALGSGLHFFFLENIKPLFETRRADGSTQLSAVGAALTGGLSRAFAAVISCPVTVVKTRMEYVGGDGGVPRYRGTLHALRTIARVDGVRGLYRGIAPTIVSNAPFSALYYMFYTRLQQRLKSGPEPTTAVNLVSSTVAAVAATLLTQPADVVRTRMQLGLASQVAGAGGGTARLGSLQLLRYIAAQQGARGLLAGAAPRMVKRSLQTALVWTLYEELAPRLSRAKHWLDAQVAGTH